MDTNTADQSTTNAIAELAEIDSADSRIDVARLTRRLDHMVPDPR